MLSVADMGREVISQRRKERDQLITGQGRRRSRVQPPKVRKSTTTRPRRNSCRTRSTSLMTGRSGRSASTKQGSSPKSALGKRLSDAGEAGFADVALESHYLAPTTRFRSLATQVRSLTSSINPARDGPSQGTRATAQDPPAVLGSQRALPIRHGAGNPPGGLAEMNNSIHNLNGASHEHFDHRPGPMIGTAKVTRGHGDIPRPRCR